MVPNRLVRLDVSVDDLPAVVATALLGRDEDWPARWDALVSATAALDALDPSPRLVFVTARIVEQLASAGGHHRDQLAELAYRVLDVHAAACAGAPPEPRALAEWLLHLQVSHHDAPEVRLVRYAAPLAADGLAHYRTLAVEAFERLPVIGFGETGRYDRTRWALLRVMEELAEFTGDVDLQVMTLAKDLSSGWHYLQVATVLQEAGRGEDALEWVQRGLVATGGRGAAARLIDLAVDECLRLGWHDRAVELRRRAFLDRPGLDTFLRLRSLAGQTEAWPRLREEALEHLRAGRDFALVRILLWEGHTAEALRAAHEQAEGHPDEAIEVYRDAVDTELAGGGERVVDWLEQLRALFVRTGQSDAFAEYLDGVKSRHAADRRLLDELARRGL
jgi:hypothetical protein